MLLLALLEAAGVAKLGAGLGAGIAAIGAGLGIVAALVEGVALFAVIVCLLCLFI